MMRILPSLLAVEAMRAGSSPQSAAEQVRLMKGRHQTTIILCVLCTALHVLLHMSLNIYKIPNYK